MEDTIIEGDCIEVMRGLPQGCADLVFADPPYNLQLENALHRPNQTRVDAVDDEWDRFVSFEEYDRFTRAWLEACRHVLSPTGTLWVIGTYHNIHRVGAAMQDLGYWLLNDVAWVKTNPMPQFRGVRFCNAHETLIWAKRSKDQARYTFNYQALKAANEDVQMRSDWYLPLCTGAERLRDAGGKVHSTQKPEALLRRILAACTHPGDTVLDPFFGSGTTGAVARVLGRRCVGIERDAGYVAAARRRIEAVTPPLVAFLDEPPPAEQRVTFGMLLEMGLVRAGDELLLEATGDIATVTADARVRCGAVHASIHGAGAALQGKPACNGWTTWMCRSAAGKWRSIDLLRKEARVLLSAPPEGAGSA